LQLLIPISLITQPLNKPYYIDTINVTTKPDFKKREIGVYENLSIKKKTYNTKNSSKAPRASFKHEKTLNKSSTRPKFINKNSQKNILYTKNFRVINGILGRFLYLVYLGEV